MGKKPVKRKDINELIAGFTKKKASLSSHHDHVYVESEIRKLSAIEQKHAISAKDEIAVWQTYERLTDFFSSQII